MKKIFVLSLAVLAVFLCFTLTSFAEPIPDLDFRVGLPMHTPGLPEEYRELLLNVPIGAYAGNTVSSTDSLHGIEFGRSYGDIFMNAAMNRGYFVVENLSMNDPVPDYRMTVTEVETVYDELFGPGSYRALSDKDRIGSRGIYMAYDAERGDYYYVYAPWMGGVAGEVALEWFEKSEEVDGELRLYFRFALYLRQSYPAGYCICGSLEDFHHGIRKEPFGPLAEGNLADPNHAYAGDWGHITLTEEFRQYLPLYCHTYRPNGAGSYYWASSALVEAGTAIPPELLELREPDPVEPSTDGVADSSTDGVTDSEAGSTGVPSAGGDGVRGVGILCAVGVSVAGLLMAAVPVVLHKIQLRKKEK